VAIDLPIEDILQSKTRVRILKILAEEGELNVTEIAKRAHNHSSIRSHLYFLVKADILQEKRFGRIRIYQLRVEDVRVRAMKNFFDFWKVEGMSRIEDVFYSKGRIRICNLLAEVGELNISEIAKRARINHSNTEFHLNFLVKANILHEKKFGCIRIYRFRNEDVTVRAIKNFFDVWKGPTLSVIEGAF